MGDDQDYRNGTGLFNDSRSWDLDIERFLESAETQQVEWLEKEIQRIEQQVEKREELHQKIVDELEWSVEQYTNRLENLYQRKKGKRDGKRRQLKDRIEQFYEEIWEERRQHWRDTQELEEERRAILRELDQATADYLADL
jgi:DNA repair exonuclease SbcCD ATPase subunit